MVSTALDEKYEKKFNVQMRGGNRGGKDQFTWDSVKDMPYNQREMYLGVSSKIGVLDKGSKYRKKDFYNYHSKLDTGDKMKEQRLKALKEDQMRMAHYLGQQIPDKKQQIIELSKDDKEQLQKRIMAGYEKSQKFAAGIGFDKLKVQIKAKPQLTKDNPHKIQGFDDYDIIKKQERSKSQTKKQKKQKKDKKDKKQKRRDRSKQKQDYDDLLFKQKKHKKQKKQKKQKKDKKQKKQKKDRKQQKQQIHKRKRSYSPSSIDSRSRSRDRRRY